LAIDIVPSLGALADDRPRGYSAAVDLQSGERVIYQGHPSWRAILGFYLKGLLVGAAAGVLAALINDGAGLGVVVFAVVAAVTILVGFIKRVATVYTITDRRLNIKIGIISRKVQETRLQRVQNVNFNQGVYERVMQIGDVEFTTAGTDESNFVFAGVAQPEEVVQQVEHATPVLSGLQGEAEPQS
jgi:membrane protein YdbS with pleckstrin-like domain